MADIVLCRIDSRLIHGQIAAQWIGYLGAEAVVVADDETAASHFKQTIMDMAVPNEVETRYWSVKETVIRLGDDDSRKRTLLVVKDPETIVTLLKKGIAVQAIDVGIMENHDDAEKYNDLIYVNDRDKDAFRELSRVDVPCYIQALPYEEKQDISELLK